VNVFRSDVLRPRASLLYDGVLIREEIEDVFRRSNGALVAALTRALGPGRLDLVEAALQDAFLRALVEWPDAPPENPGGWLMRVARNLAIDHIRRERALDVRRDAITALSELEGRETAPVDESARFEGELGDEQLAMIFVACHPCNSEASQVALALRTLCGLDVPAIARALFATEEAVEKRLVLARRRLREAAVSFEVPTGDELVARLSSVLRVAYVLFNEGYWCTLGPDVMQSDVAAEAMRLASFLAARRATRLPETHALLALMHLHASRFGARVDAHGQLVALPEQDRSRWSSEHIDAGLRFLAASATGDRRSTYHLEAAIAAVHATSQSHEETDWRQIARFYDELVAMQPSPSARLSRAIAIGFRDGWQRGLTELDALASEAIASLPPFHTARGEALRKLERKAEARAAFEQALARTVRPAEQRWIENRLALLGV
jgi:RNA polymerase sigma-70 factor, ECF subfamily